MLSKIIRRLNIEVKILYYRIAKSNISIGRNFRFRKGLTLNCSPNGKIIIGNDVFMNNYTSINAHKKVYIGDNSIIGENVKIYDHNHSFSDKNKLIKEQGYKVKEVSIGSNSWIGSNVVILAGANIGDNVVIGAGCVINSSIADNSVVKNNQSYIIESRR